MAHTRTQIAHPAKGSRDRRKQPSELSSASIAHHSIILLVPLLACRVVGASSPWDPNTVSIDLTWTTDNPAADHYALELNVLFSHNISSDVSRGRCVASLTCAHGGVTVRAGLVAVGGPVAVFRADDASLAVPTAGRTIGSVPASCHIAIDVDDGVLTSSWTGSPVLEHFELTVADPCALLSSGGSSPAAVAAGDVGLEGLGVLCELACGRPARPTPGSTALVATPIAIDVVGGTWRSVDKDASIAKQRPSASAAAFAELDTQQIPGLKDIIKLAMKILMPPVIDPFLENINDHFTHMLTSTVTKDVVGNTPKDTVALLEPDLRRNLTTLLTDSVPAAFISKLVTQLTKTVGDPLVERLVAVLEPGLPRKMMTPLHARITAPLHVTLPDRLKRSLFASLTHTLSHTLPHVLVPALGEALLVEGITAAAGNGAGGDGGFPIPLSDSCAACPHDPAVTDKADCWTCRRDEFRYWVLHRSHYHADYYAEYYRAYYGKIAAGAYKGVPLKEGGSHPKSNEV